MGIYEVDLRQEMEWLVLPLIVFRSAFNISSSRGMDSSWEKTTTEQRAHAKAEEISILHFTVQVAPQNTFCDFDT